MKENQVVVEMLSKFGRPKGASYAQVALGWLLAKRPWIVPIPGATKLHHLEENLRAVDVEFSYEEWSQLEREVSSIQLSGDRYPADQQKQVGH
jgi:aryl-alcohol dehydrogenase-like predicted oxidoreductase